MIWKVNGQEYPVLRLATLLGVVSGGTASVTGLLFTRDPITIILLGGAVGLGGFLTLIITFLADISLNAKAEGEARRARLRAASRIYREWADGTLEPPTTLHTAAYTVNGEVRRLDWLSDDDPETQRWRGLLVALFHYARALHRESKGARTGLTEADLVGDGPQHMFPGRDAYLQTIRVAKDLGLVERVNGVPTRLAEGWTFTKAITYLQTAAVIPPIKERSPGHRTYNGVRG